jgi:hypothetical protein
MAVFGVMPAQQALRVAHGATCRVQSDPGDEGRAMCASAALAVAVRGPQAGQLGIELHRATQALSVGSGCAGIEGGRWHGGLVRCASAPMLRRDQAQAAYAALRGSMRR